MSSKKTDKDYQHLQQSVTKALVGLETPLKVKHARETIIATYRYQGSAVFWGIAIRQPILENRITAWKFCHLLHKILREGHSLCCQESQGNIKYLTDVGKLWSHLTDGYGICILQYTKLLVLKIEFHIKNPRFPGALKMTGSEIEQIDSGDINFIFQLTIEIFDYLDALIGLQATVFNSLKTNHVSSMTSAGQCLVAALIPCIEDANPLYDFSIRFMFKLHVHLPHDMLDGHRQRFNAIFRQLRNFYKQSDDLQYFVNLVTVPKLPSQLPNFPSNSEYESNIVVTGKAGIVEDIIILFDEPPKQEEPKSQPSEYLDRSNIERNDGFHHMNNELSTISASFGANQEQYDQQFSKLNDDRIMLKNDIRNKNTILQQAQLEKQILQERIRQNDLENLEWLGSNRDQLIQQLHTELFTIQKEKQILEEKIQNHDIEISEVEEKFAKLLTLYMETRTDHINLLRQNQENNKAMRELKKSFEQAEKDKATAENKLTELKRQTRGYTEIGKYRPG